TSSLLEPLDRGPVAPGEKRAPRQVAESGVDHQEQHAAVPLGRVGDFQVPDVHVELAEQGGDFGEHAGPVGHRDADLDDVLRPGATASTSAPSDVTTLRMRA